MSTEKTLFEDNVFFNIDSALTAYREDYNDNTIHTDSNVCVSLIFFEKEMEMNFIFDIITNI